MSLLISWLPGLCQKVIKSFDPPSYSNKPLKHLFAKFDDDPAQMTPCKIWIFKKIQEINSFCDVINLLFSSVESFPKWTGSMKIKAHLKLPRLLDYKELIKDFGF